MILSTAASAACTGFDEVPETADCYESVMYLAECEIVAGTGNDCFSPEQLITVEQWAVMLCRAYGAETIGDSWQDVGRSSVVEAYRQGWLNETALSAPNIQLCRERCSKAPLQINFVLTPTASLSFHLRMTSCSTVAQQSDSLGIPLSVHYEVIQALHGFFVKLQRKCCFPLPHKEHMSEQCLSVLRHPHLQYKRKQG